jgi:hypothetical protein
MHSQLAAVGADLAFGPAPARADAALAAAIWRAGKLLRIVMEHLLDRANAGRQPDPREGSTHILPSRLEAGPERERSGRASAGHGVALLCGFVTPSLATQGGQRLPPSFNRRPGHSPDLGVQRKLTPSAQIARELTLLSAMLHAGHEVDREAAMKAFPKKLATRVKVVAML